ncbi:MAG: hydroxypyruvate isomerase [Hyphomicrobium sp.]
MPKFAANLSMLFTELPFLDRFAAAARAGFRGIEFLSPYQHGAGEISERLADNGLEQVLFNLPAGDWARGERGIAIFSDRRSEFREGVAKAITYAKALRCKRLHCLAGIASVGAHHGELFETYVENVKYAAHALSAEGLTLLIEPINTRDVPGYFLKSTNDARDAIRRIGAPNAFLQYDAYHMQIMEGDLAAAITRNFDIIKHIQIADAPGRHEPGTGEIDYPALFDHLDRIGYEGWVGCEYHPKTTTNASFAWLCKFAVE